MAVWQRPKLLASTQLLSQVSFNKISPASNSTPWPSFLRFPYFLRRKYGRFCPKYSIHLVLRVSCPEEETVFPTDLNISDFLVAPERSSRRYFALFITTARSYYSTSGQSAFSCIYVQLNYPKRESTCTYAVRPHTSVPACFFSLSFFIT